MSTIYDGCSKDELLQIAYEMQKDLNDSKKEKQRLHDVIKITDNERVNLVAENKYLSAELTSAIKVYNQATNEIALLNRQLERQTTSVNDLADIVETNHKVIADLKEENAKLHIILKMLTKVCLNSIYGISGTIYTDTDSIKETKDNDSNN